jgi:curved DNA-binding protein CbpA
MGQASRNPYSVLGLPQGADARAARAAFRVVAKACHPDLNPDDPGARARFEDAQAAYARIVATAKLRSAVRPKASTTPAPAAEPVARRTPPAERAAPAALRLTLSLEEAVSGAVKTVRCGRERLVVRAPAGIRPGDRLIARNRAGASVVLLAQIEPDADFRVQGGDLHGVLFLSEGALARRTPQTVETPHGPLKVRIPEKAGFGARVRVRGRGLPARAGAPAGDLYLELRLAPATGRELLGALGRAARAMGLDFERLRQAAR